MAEHNYIVHRDHKYTRREGTPGHYRYYYDGYDVDSNGDLYKFEREVAGPGTKLDLAKRGYTGDTNHLFDTNGKRGRITRVKDRGTDYVASLFREETRTYMDGSQMKHTKLDWPMVEKGKGVLTKLLKR